MKITIFLLAFVRLSYAVPTPDLFVGNWKEDNTQRTGLSDYIYYRGLSWVKRLIVNSANFELTMNIAKEGNIYKINGRKGPRYETYACQLVPDGETETEVDLDQLGGLRKATTRYEDNSLIIDLENPTTNQVDVITNHYIDPSEPNVMIYTLTDVDSGTKLVQHMNRQL